ncbi:MAG: hypothetical protein ABW007_07200 [Chitinophagaceae bacterium]
MAKNRPPAFQYYPRDTLMNPLVAVMSLEEFGAYWKLVSYVWLEGSLPSDEKQLAKLLRVTPKKFGKLWLAMEKLFKIEGDKLIHPELDEYRQKQEEWREKSAEGGRKSAQVRSKGSSKLVQSNNEPNTNQSSTLHTASASSSSLAPSSSHTTPPAANGVCARSKYTYKQCLAYAENLVTSGITNPGGYATTIHRSGEADSEIEIFLHPEKAPKPRQFNPECLKCFGVGREIVNGKGARPCPDCNPDAFNKYMRAVSAYDVQDASQPDNSSQS